MDYNRLLKLGAVAGAGLIVAGGVIWYRQKKTRELDQLQGLSGGRYQLLGEAEAPVISSRSDGNMRTEMRASENMSIEQRLATIQRKVRESVQDGEMRKLALEITRQCPERDKRCEAKAIYKAVKKRIRYTGDIGNIVWENGEVEGVDLYQSARRTWFDMKGGDCDDHSILLATLLALNGITPKLRVSKESLASDWSHIYTVAELPSGYVALDTTLPGSFRFGVEAPNAAFRDFPA